MTMTTTSYSEAVKRLTTRSRPPGGEATVSRLPGRVRPHMIAIAIVMIAVAVLGSIAAFKSAVHQRQVLALAVTVPQGQQVTAADLRATGISGGTGLATIPAADLQDTAGEYAVTTLPAGSLVTQADLTPVQVPASGQMLVPVQLKAGQLPVRGLTAGQIVIITPMPGQASGSNQAQPLTEPVQATAEETGQPDTDGMVTVDLLIADQAAAQVAAQASTGDVALLVAPQGTKG